MPYGTPKMTTIYVNDDTTARVNYQQVPQNQNEWPRNRNDVPPRSVVTGPQPQSQPVQTVLPTQQTTQKHSSNNNVLSTTKNLPDSIS